MHNTQNQRPILANGSEDVSKAQKDQPKYFDTLPDELHLEILKKVSPLELDSLTLTCRRFNRIIQDRSLWKKVVIKHRNLERGDIEKLMRRPVQHLTLVDVSTPPLLSALEVTQPSWSLKKVRLHDVEAYPEDLVKMFNKCKQLTTVDLAEIPVNNNVFVALAENKNIKKLRLRNVNLEPSDLKILLQNIRKLQEFYFEPNVSDTAILNSVCQNIAPSLRRLTFGYCFYLSDDHIVHIVRNCLLLQSLSVTLGVRLTGRSIESLSNLKHLRILKMDICHGIPPAAFLAVTEMESLVELNIRHIKHREEFREIEELFGVNMIEDHDYWRLGTFKTRFGVVRITY